MAWEPGLALHPNPLPMLLALFSKRSLVLEPNKPYPQVFFWTAVLVPVSFLLVPLNVTGYVYLGCAIVLGIGFVWRAAQGFKAENPSRWARGLFLYSLVYLTLLFAAIAVDALVSLA